MTSDSSASQLRVELARSGLTLDVNPGESILDRVLSAGIEVESNCNAGICGSCIVPVLFGRPLHYDTILSDEEQESDAVMTLCVSWCTDSRLVLDL